MRVSCPGCGADMTLDVLIAHEGAREAVLVALQLPAPIGKLIVQYLTMFRPATSRQLSWERVGSILSELREPIAAAQFERHGRTWPAPLEYWKAALEHMVQMRDQAKLVLPLKGHGYLLQVIAGMSEKAEAKDEKRTEVLRASGTLRAGAALVTTNPGFTLDEIVSVVRGPNEGQTARIYHLAEIYASLEEVDAATLEPTGSTYSTPYSFLAPRAVIAPEALG